MNKIVLAYSGGLDTSVMIKWLEEKYQAEVITLTADVGQKEDLREIEKRAKQIGAVKHYSIDAKEQFVSDFVFPAIRANALYQGKYPLSAALSRPLIALKLVDIARKEDAVAIAHGCTGKGNDQVRFEVTIRALAPELKVLAPVREWNLSRDAEIEYAKKHGIPFLEKKSQYSTDQNLWGRSIECGPLDLPECEPPEDVFEWTTSPEKSPNSHEYVTINFQNGVPIGLDGKETPKTELLETLNQKLGKHGVGRIDHVEDRLVGIKSREVYECPAAIGLVEAHQDLEKLVLTRHELTFKQSVDAQWTWLIYSGLWAEPLRKDLESFIDITEERVEGDVRLKVFKGKASVVGRSSPFSLYDLNLATYDIKTTFDQSLAHGFVELWGLPTKVANWLRTARRKS